MVPKKYKKNAIITDLHRAKKISSNFNNEVKRIKAKYKSARFLVNFTYSVVRQFQEHRVEKKIPNLVFEEWRVLLFFRLL